MHKYLLNVRPVVLYNNTRCLYTRSLDKFPQLVLFALIRTPSFCSARSRVNISSSIITFVNKLLTHSIFNFIRSLVQDTSLQNNIFSIRCSASWKTLGQTQTQKDEELNIIENILGLEKMKRNERIMLRYGFPGTKTKRGQAVQKFRVRNKEICRTNMDVNRSGPSGKRWGRTSSKNGLYQKSHVNG